MEQLEFISAFSGIGGLDLGLERAGMRCVAQIEIDPFCQKVLARHWPHVPKFGDIRDVGKDRKYQLPSADLIVGGYPCQPYSCSGEHRGAEDDRHLWPEYFRIIDELTPAWVVGENVPGITTTILDDVLSDLAGIGYATAVFIIPACAVNALHRRDRVFTISHTVKIPIASRVGIQRKHTTAKESVFAARPGESLERAREASRAAYNRVANGLPNRVDRLAALGNAVHPDVAEWIGRQIIAATR